jgi:uncharacterized protein
MPAGPAQHAGSATPPGVGLAFNPALAAFVDRHADALDHLEISPERFWRDRGPACGRAADRYLELPDTVAQLEAVRGDLPLLAHGVGLSIATAGPLDIGHVEQIARWHERYDFGWYSEHLAYFRLGPDAGWRGLGLMVPPVYDEAALHDIGAKVRRIHELLGLVVLLENTVDYTPVPDAELDEAQFLTRLTTQTPAALLLDLHNLHTDAVNHGRDPYALLDSLDLTTVTEVHLAGGEPLAGQWTDAHSGRCPEQVWALLAHLLARPHRVRAITLEADESYALRLPDEVLLDELARARGLVAAAFPGGGPGVG